MTETNTENKRKRFICNKKANNNQPQQGAQTNLPMPQQFVVAEVDEKKKARRMEVLVHSHFLQIIFLKWSNPDRRWMEAGRNN